MDNIVRFLIAFGVFAVLVTLYIGSYVLNKRTKKPVGSIDLESSCTGCAVTSCSSRIEEGGAE